MDIQQVFREWFAASIEFLPKLISGLVIFILTLAGSGFIAKWIKRIFKKRINDRELLHLIFLISRWTILIIGTVIALDQVDFNVTGFIAGLGVAGFTIGFALQDIAKNFISGMLLLYRQPFNLGDYVSVNDHSGTVKAINVRDTVIEKLDGELVIIPNQKVFENPIINYTHSKLRRKAVKIGLGYEESLSHASKIFLEAIKSVQGVEEEPAPKIRATGLGDFSLELLALFWVDQQTNDFLEVHSEVLKAIKNAAEDNSINLPYPIHSVLVTHPSEKTDKT
jgi:small-conductance mechanosensitive channel